MGTRIEEDADNPLQARVARIDGRSRAVTKPTDRMIWLRRWALFHNSAILQCGIGGLLGILLTRLAGFAALSAAVIAPIALGGWIVQFPAAIMYRRLLRAEIVLFVAENAPVRRATIVLHLVHVIPKGDALRDMLTKLVATDRIRLQDGHFLPGAK